MASSRRPPTHPQPRSRPQAAPTSSTLRFGAPPAAAERSRLMLNPDAQKLARNLPDPEEVDPPKLRRAVEQFAAMVREHNDAAIAAHVAERALNDAKVGDRDAYAAAIRAG